MNYKIHIQTGTELNSYKDITDHYQRLDGCQKAFKDLGKLYPDKLIKAFVKLWAELPTNEETNEISQPGIRVYFDETIPPGEIVYGKPQLLTNLAQQVSTADVTVFPTSTHISAPISFHD